MITPGSILCHLASLPAFVPPAGGAGVTPWLLGEMSFSGKYQKKFDVLPPEVLADGLMFIGCCVALGLLAAWLMHEESKGRRKERRPGQGPDAAGPAGDVQAPAAVKRRGRKGKGKQKAGQKEEA